MRLHAFIIIVVLSAACSSSSVEQAQWVLTEEPSGSNLQVRAVFGGSSCTSFREWRVSESPEMVEIEATYERSGSVECTADEVYEDEIIELDEPLADRALEGCRPETSGADCRRVATTP